MFYEFEGKKPVIDKKAYCAEGSRIIGDVELSEFASVWYNSVVRGDVSYVRIGKYSNIQDNSVCHVADNKPCIVGDYVTVGHNVVLHACTVEDHCLIGMGSTVLDGAVIGEGSIVAAGTVVTGGTKVPPNSLVAGIPGKVIKDVSDKRNSIHAQAIKYKTLWTRRYGLLPDGGGEEYTGEKIV